MATVIQTPEALSLSGSMKSYLFQTSQAVAFELYCGSRQLLSEVYQPSASGIIEVDVADVIREHLSVTLPSGNVYNQTDACKSFAARLDGQPFHSFIAVAGGVRKLSLPAADFLAANWLTWQPQSKPVTWDSPEYLTYYHAAAGKVMVRLYLKNGSTEDLQLATATAGVMTTYLVTFSRLFSLTSHAASELYGLADVWVQDYSGVRLSYIQRYICRSASGFEHFFLAVNSLGGIDTFCFTGAQQQLMELDHEAGDLSGRKVSLTSGERKYKQHTGPVSTTVAAWLWEFFSSQRQWAVMAASAEAIVITASSGGGSDAETINECEFDFLLSEDGKQLKVVRNHNDMPVVEVESPSGELFFLAPRLIDFPQANVEDNLLLLVQTPFRQEWQSLSLAAIKAWILTVIAPYANQPARLVIDTNGDQFLAYGESMLLTCKVYRGLYEDITGKVFRWSITRDSGDPAEDALWQLKAKVRNFAGVIEICYRADDNDLAANANYVSTIFTITAQAEDESVSMTVEI